MSLESARKFYQQTLVDENLRNRFLGINSGKFDEMVKAAGYDFTLDEINQVIAESIKPR